MRTALVLICVALLATTGCNATTGTDTAQAQAPKQGEAGAPPATTADARASDATPPATPTPRGSSDETADSPDATQPEAGAPTADTAIDSAATTKDADSVGAGTPASSIATDAPGEVDYSCTTDADCSVKDVGNCCGYYPACVNTNSPTFPDQVKAQCEKQGMSSICGYKEITACTCVEGRCDAADAGAAPAGDVQ
jgi:hypothetical protein